MALEMQILALDSHKNMAGFNQPVNGIRTFPHSNNWISTNFPPIIDIAMSMWFLWNKNFSILYCIHVGTVIAAQAMCTRYIMR